MAYVRYNKKQGDKLQSKFYGRNQSHAKMKQVYNTIAIVTNDEVWTTADEIPVNEKFMEKFWLIVSRKKKR